MNVILAILILLACLMSLNFITQTVNRLAQIKGVKIYRSRYISKTINICLSAFFVLVAFITLGVEYSQIAVFASSVFAVIGVALFAQWSILSNITASLIIFFAFPYRIGEFIHVVDKDDDISGEIEEITLFHVLIRRNNGDLVTYPNSLILQKSVIKIAPENLHNKNVDHHVD